MRVEQPWTLSYLDVDQSFQLKPVALIRRMEEAAIRHTDLVGLPAKDLLHGQGLAWMMHKIGIKIHHLPIYGQELLVTTWSKGIKGFRALREFEIRKNGRVLVSATSLWLLYDLTAKQLKRIPGEMVEAYEIESAQALDWDLAKWKPGTDFPVQTTVPITTRASDFDIYGHVNHAVYLDYIDTALNRSQEDHTRLGELRMAFSKQISRQVDRVEVRIGSAHQATMISIGNNDTVFALAECKP
ncbi:MAG: thioesterase [Desulfovermiculus sp.]|nr:thioesterase [Desulfovermiculus sp.]